MKKLLAIVLLCFVTSALAVDVTISLTAGQITRFATALGKARNLVDAQGQPRVATAAEMRQFVIDQVRGVVLETERAAATEAAIKAATVPPMDPQ